MRNYIKLFVFAIVMLGSTDAATAQEQGGERPMSREVMISRRADRMAQELSLDEATAAKFKDTYTEYLKELWGVRPQFGRQDGPQDGKRQAPTAEERQERRQKMLDIRKKYQEKYSTFMTEEQVEKLNKMEEEQTKRMRRRGGKN